MAWCWFNATESKPQNVSGNVENDTGMNKEDILYIKKNRKWSFKLSDIYNHYIILILPLSIIFISFSMFYSGNKFNHLKDEFLITAIIISLFGLLLLILIVNRILAERKFRLFELNDSNFEEFKAIIRKCSWSLVENKSESLVLLTETSWFSWGEKITIIKYNDKKILVNSRPYGQPITINRDKINYNKLEKLIKHYR